MSDLNPMPPSMPITDIREKPILDPKQPLPYQNTKDGGATLDAVKPGQKTGNI